MSIKTYESNYPWQEMTLKNGKQFAYRYYKNPEAKGTLVLLTGGIGLSDLFYLHFEHFAKEYSVITFDYQLQFAGLKEMADAAAEVFEGLHEKVWLVGQSLGGIVAQVIAKEHPEVVYGMILSNTCSLAKNMPKEAYDQLIEMMESQQKGKRMMACIPFPIYKRMIKWVIMKKRVTAFSEEEKQVVAGFCDIILKNLTKKYEIHMMDFLADAKNHLGMMPEDLKEWKGKVLLLLSEDDMTFNVANKKALIEIMPEPKVVTDLVGGHLAMLVRLDRYAKLVSEFINAC